MLFFPTTDLGCCRAELGLCSILGMKLLKSVEGRCTRPAVRLSDGVSKKSDDSSSLLIGHLLCARCSAALCHLILCLALNRFYLHFTN